MYRVLQRGGMALVVVSLAFSAHAQKVILPDPGLTPESPFYFLDLWEEKVRFLFSPRDSVRLEHRQRSTEERLAEADMLAGTSIVGVRRALEHFEKEIVQFYAQAERLGISSHDQMLERANGYLSVLDGISEHTPPEEKEFIELTKIFLIDTQIDSLRLFARSGSVERTFEIIAANIENRFERIKDVAIDEENNNEAFKEYDRYIQFSIVLLETYDSERVGTERTRTYLERITGSHERVLTDFILPRITHTAIDNYEIALNAVRKLHGRIPIVVPRNFVSHTESPFSDDNTSSIDNNDKSFPPLPLPPAPPASFE